MNRTLVAASLLAALALAAVGVSSLTTGGGKWPRSTSVARGL